MSAEKNSSNTMDNLNDSVQLVHQKLLDLAIRGKLTDQRPDEKLSEEVLSFPEVGGPFEIPANWKWVCLRNSVLQVTDGSHNPPKDKGEGIPLLSAANVINDSIDLTKIKRWVTEEEWHKENLKINIEVNDVLLTIVGTIGRSAIVKDIPRFMLQRSVCSLKPASFVLSKYLKVCLDSPFMQSWLNENSVGTAQKGIYLKTLKKLMLPIPPLAEQHRIVSVMTDADAMIRSLSSHQKVLQEKIETVQAKVLDLAIRGRLVEQRSEETLSEEVLSLPEVEGPFEIPANWKWVCLRNSVLQVTDGSHNPPKDKGEGIPLLSAANVINDSIDLTKIKRWVTEEEWHKENLKINIEVNDVLLTIVGTIGRSAIVKDIPRFMLQRSVCSLKPASFVLSKYLKVCLDSPFMQSWLNENSVGTAQKGIYLKTLKKLMLPIPPLAEQYRICEAIEALQDKGSKLTALLK